MLEDRRAGLELYLRTLLSHKDSTWRQSPSLLRFLDVPTSRAAPLPSDFTLASWIDEQERLRSTVKEIRSMLSKRDALVARGQDAAEARKASVEAKTLLADLVKSLSTLSVGLDNLASQGLTQAELRRRTDLITGLQDEVETLSKLASSSVRSAAAATAKGRAQEEGTASSAQEQRPSAGRIDLLGPAAASGTRSMGRKIGAPVETDQTRPLDNQGLLQLQQQEMDTQDSRLSDITGILRRQRFLGEEIGRELELHNNELDGLDQEVDVTTDKMGKVRQKIKRCVRLPSLVITSMCFRSRDHGPNHQTWLKVFRHTQISRYLRAPSHACLCSIHQLPSVQFARFSPRCPHRQEVRKALMLRIFCSCFCLLSAGCEFFGVQLGVDSDTKAPQKPVSTLLSLLAMIHQTHDRERRKRCCSSTITGRMSSVCAAPCFRLR